MEEVTGTGILETTKDTFNLKRSNSQYEYFAIDMHNVADVNNLRQNTDSPSPLPALFPTI